MKEDILILGGGGHAKACIDVIESTGLFSIKGIVVNDASPEGVMLGYPILGNDDALPDLIKTCPNVFIGVGQIKSPAIRKKLVEMSRGLGARFPKIISSSAVVSRYSRIGEGTIIMHGSVIQADAQVGSFTHISTGAILNGCVSVGEESFIGSGSVIFQGCQIEKNVIVSAGTIVRNNIPLGEKVF